MKRIVISQKIVDDFAKKNGYDHAEYSIHWKCYDVYIPRFKNNEIRYVGAPMMILVSPDKSMRLTNYDEGMEINGIFARK